MNRPKHEYENDIKLLVKCPPDMWLNEIAAIMSKLKEYKSIRILEWGSGKSTIFFPCFLRSHKIDFKWTSIEHFIPWYNKVTALLKKNKLEGYVDYNLVCSTHETDKDVQKKKPMTGYINFPLSLNKKYDVIFVDGRKRAECLKVASSLLKPNGVVFLHDAERPWYHTGFNYYAHWGTILAENVCVHAYGGVQKLWMGQNKTPLKKKEEFKPYYDDDRSGDLK